ncbi:HAMP domain-containing histidine kinase [Kribbella sandramycini]|uniref:histidine kinase n=1 Tax=Kribbella sandramycini TaxID=60450 RepID=A0A7Y4P1M3_9ACTN|nr:HAMP domain-containing sensor histidine kinase [Kribbella sandramycini]MBB6566237.1 signal transduction histidine kinase [Kribbella sandramycini]NOL43098.1 HAMP domain-containing histidine kinase [Kribbella sandramycini]
MKGPAADRLRRLRWWLTAVFTVANTLGLLVLAPVVIRQDAERNKLEADARVEVVTAAVLRLVNGTNVLNTSLLNQDPLYGKCPEFAILSGGVGDPFKPEYSKPCTPMDPATLDALATQATTSGDIILADRTSTSGRAVRLRAEPFSFAGNNRPGGAVVTWLDVQDKVDAHQRLVWWMLALCAALIGLAAAGSYWLSGRAIRPAMAALEQQETLLAETAHDLRTPVAALRALSETAVRDPAQRAELLPRTVRLAGRMGDIIDGLLVRARLAAGVEQLAVQPVWLDQLVAGVVEDFPTQGARISLVTAPSMVRADPTLLQRAVGNLLDNALRHGRQPGAAEAIITVTVADGRITVADQGPGIDPEVGAELFERFTSGGGSSGLGLSIVRWVALSHGGDLKVYNAEEGGAIFEFQLPTVLQ